MRILRRHRVADRPLSCQEVGKLLQRYLDGEVDGQLARRVGEHLEDCRRCGLEASIYGEIKAALARQSPALPATTLHRLREFGEQLAHQPPDHEGGDGEG
jgi:anti-sigma factor RsiW